MRSRWWTVGTLGLTALLTLPLPACPAAAAPLPGTPAPGGTLQPVELSFPDDAWVVQKLGPNPWVVRFPVAAATACAGGRQVGAIGILTRGPATSGGVGPVLTARLYGVAGGAYTVARDLTGEQLLACLRTVEPSLPAGTEFVVTVRELAPDLPAGVATADGTLDIVTASQDIGYVVTRTPGVAGRAPIGGAGLTPAVSRLSGGGLRTIVRGGNAQLYASDVTATRQFSGWRSAGGGASSDPVAAQLADGGTGAWFVGLNGQLYQGVWTAGGTFSRFIALGTPEAGGLSGQAPGVTAVSGGRFTVAVTAATGGRVWTRTYTPGSGWGGWRRVPDVVSSGYALAAVPAGVADLQLFWTDAADRVLTRRSTNGVWGTTYDLSQGLHFFGVTATSRNGVIDVFAGQSSGGLRRHFDGAWSSWLTL